MNKKDSISRTAAIEHITKHYQQTSKIKSILCYLETAPDAEPEKANRGKWKHKDGINYYFCNVCGSGNNNGGGIKTKFCPNCGARMETGGET